MRGSLSGVRVRVERLARPRVGLDEREAAEAHAAALVSHRLDVGVPDAVGDRLLVALEERDVVRLAVVLGELDE